MKVLLIVFLFIPFLSFSQSSDTTLNAILTRGKFTAHSRAFFMATSNEGALTDYYAFTTGAGLGYESPEFKHIKIGISGFFIYRVASGDLSKPDPISSTLNRYEIGLLDITDASNHNLGRLEKLFIQYRIHRSFLRAGKMILNTPFINPQDGRMSPTLEQGFWSEISEIRNLKIEAGYLTHISPRSTVKWYQIENSIGLYPSGLNTSGERSDYAGNISTKGIFLLGVTYKPDVTSLTFWNTFIENISNTSFLQIEHAFANRALYGGIQYIRQDAVGNGGNADEAKTYMVPNTYTNTLSSRIGIRKAKVDFNFNATAITGNGRFLMPREWGRDPFYTFMPRERNEGLGKLTAISANMSYSIPKKRVRSSLAFGYFHLPGVRDYALNKYAMPSYSQLNAEIQYSFGRFLRGATVQLLYIYKLGIGNDYENPKNIINKVNMGNFNLVINYKFESYHSFQKH